MNLIPTKGRILTSVLVATACACVLLLALRMAAEISFAKPVHRQTSGCEEEALFSIWKFARGQAVYADASDIPFAVSYFNWLFYVAYGAVGMLGLNAVNGDSSWLPTIMRLLTLALSVTTAGVLYRVFTEAEGWPGKVTRTDQAALCVILAFSPVFGFMNFTTRPDVAALCLEIAGFGLLLRYERTRQFALFLAAAFVLYLSWSFKHNTLSVVAGFCCWLLLQRRWREFALFTTLSAAFYTFSFAIGGKSYFYAIVQSQLNCSISPRDGVEWFVKASLKAPLLPCAIAAFIVHHGQRVLRQKTTSIGFMDAVFVFSFAWAFVLSMKMGASDYYYLPPLLFGVCWLWQRLISQDVYVEAGWWARTFLFAGTVLQLGAVLLVFSGKAGVIAKREEHQKYAALADYLKTASGPILVTDRFGNLPWLQPSEPHFVFSYTYSFDRAAGKQFRHGGIGGLIREKYFRMIVNKRDFEQPGVEPSFDSQPFTDYKLIRTDKYFSYYALVRPEE